MKGTIQGYLYSSNPDFALPLSYGGSKNTSPISKSDGDVNAITSKDLSFHTPTNVSPGKIAAAKGRKSNSRKKGSQKEQLRNRNSKF